MLPIEPVLDRSCDHYGVLGNPIAHSLSPAIHSAFARQTRQRLSYQAILAPLEEFHAVVERFRMAGGRGLNITLPFKEEAWRLAHRRAPRAQAAGAVNTLWFDVHGHYTGDNTDGVGFVRDYIGNHGGRIGGNRVLLLGAGGAVRGVIAAILAERPAQVVIANRTVSKALAIATLFAGTVPIDACGYNVLSGRRFDLIVNGTPTSLEGSVPPLPEDILAACGACYDMMYAKEPTPFVRWGRHHRAALSVDGIGMLVEQAAESFYLWRGIRPQTRPVIDRLRQG